MMSAVTAVPRDLTLGFGLPVSGSWATPGTIAAVARRAEELGYGSLWTFQRVLVPAEEDYGAQYRAVLDPVVALGFAAAVTEQPRLGVAVLNAPYVPAAILAKQLATVDVLCRGRLDVGLGSGWAPHEFAAVGATFARRGAQTAEYVAALRALWADDPVEFHGEFTDVPPARMLPKPVQRPAPPILLGRLGRRRAAPRRPDRGRLDQRQPARPARDLRRHRHDPRRRHRGRSRPGGAAGGGARRRRARRRGPRRRGPAAADGIGGGRSATTWGGCTRRG